MRRLPDELWERLDKLIDEGVLAWAIAIELKGEVTAYLTSNNRDVLRKGITYTAFPLKVTAIRDSGDGDLPTFNVALSNVGRFPMPYLESRSFDQARLVADLVWLVAPDTDVIRFDAVVQSATASAELVTLNVGAPDWFEEKFPGRRWLRTEQFPAIVRNRN